MMMTFDDSYEEAVEQLEAAHACWPYTIMNYAST